MYRVPVVYTQINFMSYKHWLLGLILSATITCSKKPIQSNPIPPPESNSDTTFTNPLLSSGPDPWVIQKDTNYYYLHTLGNRVGIFKTSKMSKLINARYTTVWTPPATTGPYSRDIWAPEMHYLQNKWYIYFAADDGNNKNHRIYVLENSSADPTSGTWEFKGKVAALTDKWAIDASVFEYNGQTYMIWSGWEGDVDGRQNIYIAKMTNPWTITGDRVLISTPTYDWEKSGNLPVVVNEGPEAIKNSNGQVFLTFSASGCWTDDYALGLLTLKPGGDPMNPSDWTKSPNPVFTKKPENGAYAPGHNGFFKSRDGSEDWIIYHANSLPGQGCGDVRSPRMQKFTWNADGTPNFGEPVKINTPIRKPAGE
jgi:GH43 family beta-xylosidase